MEALPIVDLQAALERCDQDVELYKELVSIFRQEFPTNIIELKGCFESRDWETSTRVAHSMKGALANLGATKGSKCAHALEVACREQSLPPPNPLMNELIAAVAEFDREISEKLNIPAS